MRKNRIDRNEVGEVGQCHFARSLGRVMKVFGGILLGVGFLLAIGAAGSADVSTSSLSLQSMIVLGGIGIILLFVGQRIISKRKG